MRLIIVVTYRQYFKSSEDKKFMSMPKRVFLFDHELSIWVHARGVSADSTKVQAMLEWPLLKSLKALRLASPVIIVDS